MKSCPKCSEEVTFGATCSLCNNEFHYHCGGVTETGYRRLGDRKATWKCLSCKDTRGPASPMLLAPAGSQEFTLANVMEEIALLNLKMDPLFGLADDVKRIRDDVQELKSKFADISSKITSIERRVTALESQQEQVTELSAKLMELEGTLNDNDQWLRANNVEIKGVPMKANENLFEIVAKIGEKLNYPISKKQINYVTRVPTRSTADPKPIIVSFISRYAKEDFVAAGRLMKVPLDSHDLGCGLANSRIFVNDHLTFYNKQLLTKAKQAAKKVDFEFIWVKHAKIMARKNSQSKIFHIRNNNDIAKII